jgi:hypothetical protein
MFPAPAAAYRNGAYAHLAPNQSTTSRSIKEQFSGTWKLVSWKIERANGELVDSPLGPTPLGWIMYHPDGCMCVAFMRPDRPKFASNNLMEAASEEIKAGFEGYISYCGYYKINEQEHFVTHHLQLSWFPNLVGSDQTRYFEFTGDRLTLRTPPLTLFGLAEVHSLTWQRLN